jgi:hypothetical protein
MKRMLPLGSLAVAAGGVAWEGPERSARVWLAGVVSLGIGIVALRRATRVSRVLGWGVAMVVASLGPQRAGDAAQACGALGAAVSAAAACVAMVRVPPGGGIVGTASSSPLSGIVAVAFLWSGAMAARWGSAATSEARADWGVAAAVATATVLLGETEWMLRRRRLEIGFPERALAIRALLWLSFGGALVVALMGRAEPGAIARGAVALASALAGAAALHADAVQVARLARRATVLVLAGGGVALLGASVAAGGAGLSWEATLVTAAVALAVGAAAPALEGPLRPARGVWLDAFASARTAASRADPEDAIRDALLALRVPAGLSSPSPSLWTLGPGQVTAVDAAGYLHDRDAELPERLVAVAAGEPEGTLRADVLTALEVRRPDLRSLCKWMTDRDASLAAVVACDGEVEGMLVIPRVARDEPPTLEEVRALRVVADCLAAACRARAARAHMLSRMTRAAEQAERATEQLERWQHQAALDAGRHALAAARLARPASVGVYSAGSRMALEAIERRTAAGAPVAVVAPSGVDAIAYLARAHLAGIRSAGPLVVVDATSAREQDLARWGDPRASPLALAHGGMLVLLDGAALPADIQQLVARVLAEKIAPWARPEPVDVELAITGMAHPEELVAAGRLDPSLALRLADACAFPVVLPRLCDRAEDLRAIITDHLAREGLRRFGAPVGIEQAAYARLLEYAFPGEDTELAVVVRRLVARCSGDMVRVADVEGLQLSGLGSASARQGHSKNRKSPLSA